MKKKRPHIPLDIQLRVAYRQLAEIGVDPIDLPHFDQTKSKQYNLDVCLDRMFGDHMAQLDHDPALGLRDYDEKTGKWTPDANNSDYLVWRAKEGDHRIKTYVRGERGARSDIAEMKHRRIVAKNKLKRLAKRKKARIQPRRSWPSRPIRRRPK